MRLPFLCICLLSLICFPAVLPQLSGQTPVDGDADLRRQVGALRDAVIQQTRQIDALTAEIERLGVALGQRRPSAPAPVVAPTPAPLAGETPRSAATPAPAAVVVPTPTPDPNVVQHTVVKGENLTILAKKYSTTAEAIQKMNKITDARKIQVGQVLSIPTPPPSPAPAASASPTPATP